MRKRTSAHRQARRERQASRQQDRPVPGCAGQGYPTAHLTTNPPAARYCAGDQPTFAPASPPRRGCSLRYGVTSHAPIRIPSHPSFAASSCPAADTPPDANLKPPIPATARGWLLDLRSWVVNAELEFRARPLDRCAQRVDVVAHRVCFDGLQPRVAKLDDVDHAQLVQADRGEPGIRQHAQPKFLLV